MSIALVSRDSHHELVAPGPPRGVNAPMDGSTGKSISRDRSLNTGTPKRSIEERYRAARSRDCGLAPGETCVYVGYLGGGRDNTSRCLDHGMEQSRPGLGSLRDGGG